MRLCYLDRVGKKIAPRQQTVTTVNLFPATHNSGDRKRERAACQHAVPEELGRSTFRCMAGGVEAFGSATLRIMKQEERITAE